MKFGLFLPAWTGSAGGATLTTRELIALARHAAAIGFESFWVSDHFLNEPYLDFPSIGIDLPVEAQGLKMGQWECWTLLSALAASIDHVTLGSLVTNTGFRNPALLARMIDTVDDLSGGRVVAGLGAGDFPTEHAAFGYSFERPVARFEEALQIIRPLLRGAHSTFEGEFYTTRDAWLYPKSARDGGAPIMIGSVLHRPRMLRLVAQYADQWNCMMPFGDSHVSTYDHAWAAVRAACDRHGRDPATLARNVTVAVTVLGATYGMPQAVPLAGDTGTMVDACAAFAARGVETLSMVLEPCTPAGLDALAPVLEAFRG